MNFIPPNESAFYIRFFSIYTKWKLRRSFDQLWIKQEYQPSSDSRTVYYLNHNSWWDGLIPLYLNENLFHQKARAIMEMKQMREHSFFNKIGAFSIDLDNPRSSLTSLRYALKSMERERSCLFIYPEGKITPVSEGEPKFKNGLSWLYKRSDKIDFVPIGIYMHSFRSPKPELYISIGSSVVPDKELGNKDLTKLFQRKLHDNLTDIRSVAGYSDSGFTPQF